MTKAARERLARLLGGEEAGAFSGQVSLDVPGLDAALAELADELGIPAGCWRSRRLRRPGTPRRGRSPT